MEGGGTELALETLVSHVQHQTTTQPGRRSGRVTLHSQREPGPEVCLGPFPISQTALCSVRVRGSQNVFYILWVFALEGFKSKDQILWSFVTISTFTVWSNELQMHRPLLSGLQSKLEMGWVDNVTFCRRLTEPATPISTPSESFFDRWIGYSLKIRSKCMRR